MSLTLYYHPLSSFCQKVLIALYENDTPFTPHQIDLRDPASRAELVAAWPLGKFPVLHDEEKKRTVPESSIIIEYLARYYPGKTALLPNDPDMAREIRLRDRFFDLHIQPHSTKMVVDTFRPKGAHDVIGLQEAKGHLAIAYDMLENRMVSKDWAMGPMFTMADCAAAPALLYANAVEPFGPSRPKTMAYLERLMQRPSFARVLKESAPYINMFPMANAYHAAYDHIIAR